MAFPRLLRQSEGLQTIPHPKDFSLDDVVKSLFGSSAGRFRDFVEEGYYADTSDGEYDKKDDNRVLDFARQTIFHPETDTGAIRSRQEILQYFMAHPDLVKLVLTATINPEYNRDWETRFDRRVERAEAYLAYVEQLSEKLTESENPELEAFRDYVNSLATRGERLKELRQALSDIQKPVKLELSTKFRGEPSYLGNEVRWEREKAQVQAIFASGRKQDTIEEEIVLSWYYSNLKINYSTLFAEAVQQVKSRRGKNLVASGTPAELEVFVDEESGKVTGKVMYHKLGILDRLLRKKATAVATELDFKPIYGLASSFSTAIKYLKSERYFAFLEGFNQDIKDFATAVVELRYLAIAADHFSRLQKQGVPITMPVIVEADDRRMSATGLIEPNLLRKLDLGSIVANDASAEASGNLYVITGPNNNGKTTYMNALGIAQAMGQAGLMVFARDSVISPRDNIFTHYIRPGDLVAGESRHAHELTRIKEIGMRATGNSLILMDEPCTGTAPEDGKQQADDVLRTIGELGATVYIATHFHNLIDTANELPYGRNLYCVINPNEGGLVYTYKILPGYSTQSNGTVLAREMGADRRGLMAVLLERVEKEGLQLRI